MMVAMAPVLTGSDRGNSRPLSGSLPSLVPRFPGGKPGSLKERGRVNGLPGVIARASASLPFGTGGFPEGETRKCVCGELLGFRGLEA
jgi:hypothetical protein